MPSLQSAKRSIFLFVLAALPAPILGQTIVRTSGDVLYTDLGAQLDCAYASYVITNTTGMSLPNAHVTIDSFTGGLVALAPLGSSSVALGPLAPGESAAAYFYLQARAETGTPQGHTIHVFPDATLTGELSNASFTVTTNETIAANSNKVTTVVHGPDPPVLGGLMTITVTGTTGTIGSAKVLSFTPATDASWPAEDFQLVHSTVTLLSGNIGTFDDQLLIPSGSILSSANTDYTWVYTFKAVGATQAPALVSPVGYISSGAQVKHTSTSNFGSFAPVQPPENLLRASKSVTPTIVPTTGGRVTYTVRFENLTDVVAGLDLELGAVEDVLPSTPGSPTYVVGSSTWAGSPIADPAIAGVQLSWPGPFVVPKGALVDLVFQADLPAVDGSYLNQAIGRIGPEQIDSTENLQDDLPAEATAIVGDAADLQVTLTVDDATPGEGDSITYTITVTNAGPDDATGISLVDALPSGVTYQSDTGGGAYDSVSGTWTIGPLAASGMVTLDIVASVDAGTTGQTITNTTSGLTADQADPDDTNDVGSVDITVVADEDGDGITDSLDLDSDNDGVPNTAEGVGDLDGDGIPNELDLDSDGDGIADLIEAGGTDADGDGRVDGFTDANSDGLDDTLAGSPLADPDSDLDTLPDRVDVDADGDGIPDLVEAQSDAGYTAPSGSDMDGDGIDDAYDPDDGGTALVPIDSDGTLPDYLDDDSDGDGVPDLIEGHDANTDGVPDNTPSAADADGDGLDDAFDTIAAPGAGNAGGSNAALQDTDGNGSRNWRDDDDDGDGMSTASEDTNSNSDWSDDDGDGDGTPDYLDPADADGDGIFDAFDLDSDNDGLPNTAEGVGDLDGDGIPNELDLDSDGDGIADLIEAGGTDADGDGRIDGFTDANSDGLDDTLAGSPLADPDSDGDTRPDRVDVDADDDGIPDLVEAQSDAGYTAPSGSDMDGDGIDDAYDPDDGGTALVPIDSDGTLPDYLDDDSDGDGVPDLIEGHDADMDGVPDNTPSAADADGDGLDDAFDTIAAPGAGNAGGSNAARQDTDGNGVLDWRDDDDDGDGASTASEDTNSNSDWSDDDDDGDGTPDYLDNDDADGDGVPDSLDLDADNDGIPNTAEGAGDLDGDGIPNELDLDSDGDGIADLIEAGGTDADGDGRIDGFTDANSDGLDDTLAGSPLADPDSDGDTRPDRVDVDADGDGIPDLVEAQNDAGYVPPSGSDTDGDGIDDAYDPDDGGTALVPVDTDGTLPDYLDDDSDGDGVPDLIEGHDADMDGVPDNTPSAADADGDGLDDAFDTIAAPGAGNAGGSNAARQDTDGNGVLDWRDDDDDGDGASTASEDTNSNSDWSDDDDDGDGTPDYLDNDDADGDGVPDSLDLDSDNDGIPNAAEGAGDLDGDGIPNELDLDSDGDGIADLIEAGGTDADGDGRIDGFTDANSDGLDDTLAGSPLADPDSDGDTRPDRVDVDADGDGIPDLVEAQNDAGYVPPSGSDTDGDGIDDAYDPDDGGTALVPVDTDGTLPDYLDDDSDGDGVPDLIEGHDANTDGVPDNTPNAADADGDGLDDAFDTVAAPGAGNATGSNAARQDTDGNGVLDWRDDDDDGDGASTASEDTNSNSDWSDDDDDGDGTPDYLDNDDADGDGVPDSLDLDSDNDGLPNTAEGVGDLDGDGIPNELDLDSDGDGIADLIEAGGTDADGDGRIDGFTDANSDGLDDTLAGSPLADPDSDGDTRPDRVDVDADDDGIPDLVEAQSDAGYTAPSGSDMDGDGIDDAYDPDGGGTALVPIDSDGTLPDYLDDDSDGDGVPDLIEGHDADLDGVPDNTPSAADADGDGLDDAFDTIAAPGAGNATGSNAALQDTDGNGVLDWRDDDDDGDGMSTASEDTNSNGDWSDDDDDGDGTPDYLDPADVDGDGVPDAVDLDSDNDGIPNTAEGVGDLDGDGIPNELDLDSDGDGIADLIEAGGTDADGDGRVDGFTDANSDGLDDTLAGSPLADPDSDGDTLPDRVDVDADGDGIPDLVEAQSDAGYTPPSGSDTDGDGIDDAYDPDDGGTALVPIDSDGTLPDYLDDDSDGDGVPDLIEGHDADLDGVPDNTPSAADADGDGLDDAFDTIAAPGAGNATGSNAALQDTDGNGVLDWRDDDDDGDGMSTASEDTNSNGDWSDDDDDGDGTPDYLDPADVDGDGVPDAVDLDSDNDGIPNTAEGVGDLDGDGIPNELDLDSDGDGIADLIEAGGTDADGDGRVDGFTDANSDGLDDTLAGSPLADPDSDGDTLPDRVDVDADGDGIPDLVEAQSDAGYVPPSGSDTDGDGIDDAYDPDDGGTALVPVDTDGTLPDYLDDDSDGDGVPDLIEGHDADMDGVPDNTPSAADADGDGLDDAFDTIGAPGAGNAGGSNAALQDTDGNGGRNWRDDDDDGDGMSTASEDTNSNGDWSDDDDDGDGTPDYLDPADVDGDGIPDAFDLDADNDGIPNTAEGAGDLDGDGIPNELDLDSDGDGIVDLIEAGGTDADGDGRVDGFTDANSDGLDDTLAGSPLADPDSDGDTRPDRVDVDADDDGIPDLVEAQSDAGYVPPSGSDTDGDGIDDAYDPDDGGTALVPVDTDGTLPDYLDDDSDGDGVPDLIEGHDADMDGVPDNTPSAADADGDGLDDAFDTIGAPGAGNAGGSNAALQDTDGNGVLDWRDSDDDGDGTSTASEDTNSNNDWSDDDSDGDGTPDYLDPAGGGDSDGDGVTDDTDLDDDNDGIPDSDEGNGAVDSDGDGVPDSRDLDSDNDGVPDLVEAGGIDGDGDGRIDGFTDGNGDGLDDTLTGSPLPRPDSDGDGVRDVLDLDSDNDGIPDLIEAGGNDSDGDGRVDGFSDATGDGWDDATAVTGLPRPDSDGDGLVDAADIDSDDDGLVDNVEGQTGAGYSPPSGTDSDGDGWDDAYDSDSGGTPFTPNNTDGADQADYLDDDSDNDGVSDSTEGNDADMDGIADTTPAGTDADGDGLDDAFDTVAGPAAGNSTGSNAPLQNSDGADEPDWRDPDDDNDGVLTVSEDQNGNGDRSDDDANGDGTPNYVDDTAGLLEVSKTGQDDNGAPLAPGDVITYTLLVENLTTEDALNAVLLDSIPANTSYVASSTLVDGVVAPDVGGTSPLVSGLTVNSSGDPAGTVAASGSVTVEFQVTVEGTAVAGTQVTNVASVTFDGTVSGGSFYESSDDPTTATDDDGTSLTVGSSPSLAAHKTATDADGSPLLAGDTLVYSIRVANSGTADATGVALVDAVPGNTTFVPGSLLLDPDGSGPAAPVALTDAQDGDAGDFDGSTSGAVTVSLSSLSPDTEAVVSFSVQVAAGASSGELVSNQAVVSSNELPDLPSDADGDSQNGLQATNLVVGSLPALRLLKSVSDVDGGVMLPGDVLEYRLELSNFGGADATNAIVTDPLPPAGTSYLAGSTTQNGQPLADDAGPASPLVGGMSTSVLRPGEAIVWTARVQVNAGLTEGTPVSNQASFVADGGLSGLSDSDLDDGLESGNDGSNPNDDDPTDVTVGGAPGYATLSGNVWRDLDHDRSFGAGESGVAGFVVELLQDGALLDTTVTDVDGLWQLQGLVPGSGYQVRFRDPVSGAVWGDAISDAPGSTVDIGIVDNLTLLSGTTYVDVSLPLDPSGVLYDAVTRAPIAGAVMSLEGPPGFDPAAHLLPGQQGQVTGADGLYRFDLLAGFPPGVYTVRVNAPAGYSPIVPSLTIPPQAGPLDPTGFPDPFLVVPNNGAPMGADPTTYYLEFDLEPGDPNVVNNHIPLDPLQGAPFTVVKTSSKNRASVGEIVPFTIRTTNNLAATITNVQITDLLPPGFKYVEGSGQVDDVQTEPQVGTNPLELTWPGLDFNASQTRTITLLAVVGTGVQRGVFRNRAFAEDDVDTLLSNVAEATVLVVPDPLFEQSDVIGQVFEDRDGDGYQGDDEPGIPGVTLVTVRGLRVTTDEHGRFHIARPEDPTPTIGSNFILKLAPQTLPLGFELTTENPRVIRMTPGKLHKINFGVRPTEGETPARPGMTPSGSPEPEEGVGAGVSSPSPRAPAEEGSAPPPRTVDGELDPLDIHVRADGKDAEPTLNVTTVPDVAGPAEAVRFYAYADYTRWIERAEVRLFAAGESTRSEPLATLPMTFGAEGTPWDERLGPGSYLYVLRVYDASGVFDETAPKELLLTEEAVERLHGEPAPGPWPGYAENFRSLENIDVRGVRVLVNGRDVPEQHVVTVMDQEVPVDADGQFVFAEWVPYGDHSVTVDVQSSAGEGLRVERPLHVPEDEWFFVGLADLTVGTSSVSGPADPLSGEGGLIEDATGTPFEDEVYVNGRAAFYLKGVIRGEYLLTASLDTRDQPLEDILKGLDQKDPQSLFRRIQPGEIYAIYGDDSTTLEDAPTQGKFYVRLERGDSYALWGNFITGLTGADLAQVDRGLYGAKLHWESPEKTIHGDDRSKVNLFAASPDTALARDELLGTGGTVYSLKNQDITVGSERVRVEIRDRDSGIVLESKYLIPFTDYTIDYIQGRVVLTTPLPTVADDGQLISDGSLSGNPVFLVARYEHTPSFTDTDNLALGGRAESWVNDKLKVGVTASQEEQEIEDQTLVGADVTYRHSDGTYLKAEVAHTEGNGFGEDASPDGGFTFGGQPQAGNEDITAQAFRVEGALEFLELMEGAGGSARFYFQHRDRGFSAPGQLTAADTDQWGVEVDAPVGENNSVHFKVDEIDVDQGVSNRAYDLDVTRRLDEQWSATFGVRHTEVEDGGAAVAPDVGDRTDLAARLDYESGEDWSAYVYGQATADTTDSRADNNRVGVGGKYLLNDKLSLGGEVSAGDGGLGAGANLDYKLRDNTDIYLNYLSSSDRSDIGTGSRNGSFAAGMRTRFNDELSIFVEERVLHGSGPSGITHSFGVDLAATEEWTFGAFFETGELEQPLGPRIERTSVSLTGNYQTEPLRYGGALEFRDDEVSGEDRNVWVAKNNLAVKLDPSWTALGEANLLRSSDDSGTFFDGEFTEALLGFAYRPVDNDRWNYLFTYRYLDDTPTQGQFTASGGGELFQQRSHVLAADVTWQTNRWLAIGGKYALRSSELRTEDSPWFDSTAQLGILRGDFHVVHDWDVLLEGRWTDVDLADDRQYGILAALYRHLGEHVKVGVGYNFTDFSDDITDLSYDAKGVFVNFVGKL